MPVALSDRLDVVAERDAARGEDLSGSQRALLLLLNLIPLQLVVSSAVLFTLLPLSWPLRLLCSTAFLYLAPPLLARLIRSTAGSPEGQIAVGTLAFNAWWVVMQLQILFSRFPVLEELLRVVPGAYSAWLRLWGARIGKLTYWSPGIRILDRPYVRIGDRAIVGAGVRFSSHVFRMGHDPQLLLAAIEVGDGACIGGFSILACGARVAPRETTTACLRMAPYSVWENGRLRQVGGRR